MEARAIPASPFEMKEPDIRSIENCSANVLLTLTIKSAVEDRTDLPNLESRHHSVTSESWPISAEPYSAKFPLLPCFSTLVNFINEFLWPVSTFFFTFWWMTGCNFYVTVAQI